MHAAKDSCLQERDLAPGPQESGWEEDASLGPPVLGAGCREWGLCTLNAPKFLRVMKGLEKKAEHIKKCHS